MPYRTTKTRKRASTTTKYKRSYGYQAYPTRITVPMNTSLADSYRVKLRFYNAVDLNNTLSSTVGGALSVNSIYQPWFNYLTSIAFSALPGLYNKLFAQYTKCGVIGVKGKMEFMNLSQLALVVSIGPTNSLTPATNAADLAEGPYGQHRILNGSGTTNQANSGIKHIFNFKYTQPKLYGNKSITDITTQDELCMQSSITDPTNVNYIQYYCTNTGSGATTCRVLLGIYAEYDCVFFDKIDFLT